MEHYYKTLSGENWFNYEDFYSYVIDKLPNNSKMVEVGSWLGRSISFFVVESINKNKNIECYCVDFWTPYSEIPTHHLFENDGVYRQFKKNIEPIKNYITHKKGESGKVSLDFEDNYFDFVFIDASHDYENVLNDIKCWFPKLKKNGIIGGHDYYDNNGVVKAVNEFFYGKKIQVNGPCWFLEL